MLICTDMTRNDRAFQPLWANTYFICCIKVKTHDNFLSSVKINVKYEFALLQQLIAALIAFEGECVLVCPRI